MSASRTGRRSRGESSQECDPRAALRADVAHRYYVQRLTQKEIAYDIGRSVPTVSRLLAEAEASDVVAVQVRYQVPVVADLQQSLVNRFGLRVARVAAISPDQSCNPLAQVADLAARYLTTVLTDGAVVSVAWGSSIHEAVRRVKPAQHRGIHVVQGLGSLGSLLPAIDNPGIVQKLASRVDGTAHLLPAPMILASKTARDALAREPQFGETLRLGRRSDVAVIGIGLADPELSGMCRAGYLDPGEMEDIRAAGAVGDVMVEFFDLHGRFRETAVGDRVLGLRLSEFGHARTVIAVARGTAKVPAVLGALRTGVIDVLMTDSITARRILDLADAHPEPHIAPALGKPIPHPSSRRVGGDASDPDGQLPPPSNNLRDVLRAILTTIARAKQGASQPGKTGGSAPSEPERDLHVEDAPLLVAALERGKARGELKTEAECQAIADLLLAAVWYRKVVALGPIDDTFLRGVIASVIDGNTPPAHTVPGPSHKGPISSRLDVLPHSAQSGLRAVR